jgi:hypothetical protein
MRRPANGTIAITLGLFAGIGLGPLILRGNSADEARRRENARQISEMTETERAQLERNEQAWRNMTDDQRARWRDFAGRLQVDRQTSQGRLTGTMDDYYRWLGTLHGHQRDQLRQAQSVPEKTEFVRMILNDQLAQRIDVPEMDLPATGPGGVVILSREQLAEVMTAIENEVLFRGEREQLVGTDGTSLAGLARYIKTIQLLRARFEKAPALLSGSFRTEVLQALPPEVRAMSEDGRRPMYAYMTLWASLKAEFDRELSENAPDITKLRDFFDEMPEEHRVQMYNLAAGDFVSVLKTKYLLKEIGIATSGNAQEALDFLDPRRVFEGQFQERGPGERGQFRKPEVFRMDRGGFPERGGEGPPGDRPFEGDRPSAGDRAFGGDRPPGGDRPIGGDRSARQDGSAPEGTGGRRPPPRGESADRPLEGDRPDVDGDQ